MKKGKVDVRYYSDDALGLTVCKMEFDLEEVVDSMTRQIHNRANFIPSMTGMRGLVNLITEFIEKRYAGSITEQGWNSTITFKGYAKCRPGDEYSAKTGEELAYKKALDRYRRMKRRVLSDLVDYYENLVGVIKNIQGIRKHLSM